MDSGSDAAGFPPDPESTIFIAVKSKGEVRLMNRYFGSFGLLLAGGLFLMQVGCAGKPSDSGSSGAGSGGSAPPPKAPPPAASSNPGGTEVPSTPADGK